MGERPGLLLKGDSGLDEVGMKHVRFQQLHRGIPVAGTETIVHLKSNEVTAASTPTIGLDLMPTEPGIVAEDA